jgi:hypothetical protein
MLYQHQVDELSRAFDAVREALLSTAAAIEPVKLEPPKREPAPAPIKSKPAIPVPDRSNELPEDQNNARPATLATGPPSIDGLPDFAIVTRVVAASLIGSSIDTMKQLERTGKGPIRVRVSQKIIGYRIGDLKTWIAQLPTA